MSEIANQLKSQDLDTVIVDSFNAVGGRTFPDINASTDIMDLVKIVSAWQSTHVQTYGNPLPNAAFTAQLAPTDLDTPEVLLSATDNEVILVTALSFEHRGAGATIVGHVDLDGVRIAAFASPAGENNPLNAPVPNLYLSKGYDLTVTVTQGDPNDLLAHVAYVYCSR